MSYVLEFSKIALTDIDKHKKPGDKATLKKIEKLLNELMEILQKVPDSLKS